MSEGTGPGAPHTGDAGPEPTPAGAGEQPRIVIRDKRRFDPETGEPRTVLPAERTVAPGDAAADAAGSDPGPPKTDKEAAVPTEVQLIEIDRLTTELAERTGDLQRVSAEYANYRRRVDRDRAMLGEMAQDRVLLDLLPVLDDIALADSHGDLTGGFKNVADALAGALAKSGLQTYGEAGDLFDPTLHEAVAHSTSPDVDGPTCVAVMRQGYRRGERVLRTAMVAVADPE